MAMLGGAASGAVAEAGFKAGSEQFCVWFPPPKAEAATTQAGVET